MSIKHQHHSWLSGAFVAVGAVIVLLRLLVWKLFPGADTMVKEDLGNMIVAGIQLSAGIVYFALAGLGRVRLRATGFEAPLSLMVLTATVSLAYSLDFSMSIRVLVPLLGCLAMFYILANSLDSLGRMKFFLYFILGCALVTSVFGIREFFILTSRQPQAGDENIAQYNVSLHYILTHHRVTSFLGWPNSLAGYLSLILPFSIVSVFLTRVVWLKFCLGLVSMVLLGCMLVTFSFLGWLSFLLATLLMLPVIIHRFVPRMNIWLKTALLAWAGIMLLLFLVVILRKNFIGSILPRMEYYAQAWHLVLERPWLGSGYGTFGIAARPLVHTLEALTNYVHNSYLQWWVECGVIGLGAVCSLVAVFGVRAYRILSTCREGEVALVALALVWGMTAFFIDNFFSFTLIKPNIAVHGWALFAVFAALGLQLSTIKSKVKTAPGISWAVGALFACFLVMAVILGAGLLWYKRGLLCLSKGDLDGAGRAFVQASTIDRWSFAYPSAAGDMALRVFQASRKEYHLRLAEINFLEAVRREPLQYAPRLVLSRIYQAFGENDTALIYARDARRLSPYEFTRDMGLIAQQSGVVRQ